MELFLAAMGGLLGLGFGFSVISAIEIVYFFTIRLYLSGSEQNYQQPSMKKGVSPDMKDDVFSNDKMFYKKSNVLINGFISSTVMNSI